jgi:hypothetical protein
VLRELRNRRNRSVSQLKRLPMFRDSFKRRVRALIHVRAFRCLRSQGENCSCGSNLDQRQNAGSKADA